MPAATAAAAAARRRANLVPLGPAAGSSGAVCQAAATDTLELTEENVETVLDEVRRVAGGGW